MSRVRHYVAVERPCFRCMVTAEESISGEIPHDLSQKKRLEVVFSTFQETILREFWPKNIARKDVRENNEEQPNTYSLSLCPSFFRNLYFIALCKRSE